MPMLRERKRLSRIEHAYASEARLVACTDVSPLVQMAHDAFYEHRPIALSPDVVWFTIAQGFATHVNLNAETLRSRFVRHEGKLKLRVTHPGILLGQPSPWPEAYFEYELMAGCGIPQITPGPSMGEMPSGLASAPVCVIDARTGEQHMRFVAGMFGVIEDAVGALSPEFGWAITYDR